MVKYYETVKDFIEGMKRDRKLNTYTAKWRTYRFAKDFGKELSKKEIPDKDKVFLTYKIIHWSEATEYMSFTSYCDFILSTIKMVMDIEE